MVGKLVLPADVFYRRLKAARREGRLEAAELLQRESDKVMRRAERVHNAAREDSHRWDEYEDLESHATFLNTLADRVRRMRGPAPIKVSGPIRDIRRALKS